MGKDYTRVRRKNFEQGARAYNKRVRRKNCEEGELVWKVVVPIDAKDRELGK